MFEKLCGKNAFQNVILTTTMWDRVDALTGNGREKELKKGFWKGVINQGSMAVGYFNTPESAWYILDRVIGHDLAILLQRQMVDLQKQLRETDPDQTLYNELESLVRRQQLTLQEIQIQHTGLTDQKVLKHLQSQYDELRGRMDATIVEMQNLKISVGERFLRYFSFGKLGK